MPQSPTERDHFQAIPGTGANILTAAQGVFDSVSGGSRIGSNNQHQLVDSVEGENQAWLLPNVGNQTPINRPQGIVLRCWASGPAVTNNDGDVKRSICSLLVFLSLLP